MQITYDKNFGGDLLIRFGEDVGFTEVERLLTRDWFAKEIYRIGTFDQGWLDLQIDKGNLCLHWDATAGLCLISRDSAGEQVLRRIGESLSAT